MLHVTQDDNYLHATAFFSTNCQILNEQFSKYKLLLGLNPITFDMHFKFIPDGAGNAQRRIGPCHNADNHSQHENSCGLSAKEEQRQQQD